MKITKRSSLSRHRERRDEQLGRVTAVACFVYGLGTFIWLGYEEAAGKDVLLQAVVIYLSYMAIFAVTLSTNRKWTRRLVRSTISYFALAVKLIVVFPFRVLLYGLEGYKKYYTREVRRIHKLETDRFKNGRS